MFAFYGIVRSGIGVGGIGIGIGIGRRRRIGSSSCHRRGNNI